VTEWEYRIENIPLQEKWFGKQAQEFQRFVGEFNDYGADGWELVSYQAMPTFGAVLGGQKGNVFLAIFKRRLDDRPADWYPDPEDVAQLRYWDGSDWTDETAPA
jgi:Protein of unknown function (DUF2510)/Domain of unknown function (DUF4177)